MEGTATNNDREIWRENEDDYYAPSIHVTAGGSIGINIGGSVIVMDVRDWFSAGKMVRNLAQGPPPAGELAPPARD